MENSRMTAARGAVSRYYESIGEPIEYEKIFIVWFSKILGNWKALVSTDLRDGRYFEVTFDGNANKIYLDVYVKNENVVYDN